MHQRRVVLPATTEYDTGWGIAGRLGYAWASGLRVDGELSYRRNDVDKSNFVGTDGVNFFNQTDEGASGHARQIAIMANAYYDFINSTGITPYIGGGIGATNIRGEFTSSFHVPTQQAITLVTATGALPRRRSVA